MNTFINTLLTVKFRMRGLSEDFNQRNRKQSRQLSRECRWISFKHWIQFAISISFMHQCEERCELLALRPNHIDSVVWSFVGRCSHVEKTAMMMMMMITTLSELRTLGCTELVLHCIRPQSPLISSHVIYGLSRISSKSSPTEKRLSEQWLPITVNTW